MKGSSIEGDLAESTPHFASNHPDLPLMFQCNYYDLPFYTLKNILTWCIKYMNILLMGKASKFLAVNL